MKPARILTIVSLTAVLLACGQKGPLVLPDKQKAKRAIPSAAKPVAKPTPSSPDPANGNPSSATGTAPGAPAPAPSPQAPAPSTTPTP